MRHNRSSEIHSFIKEVAAQVPPGFYWKTSIGGLTVRTRRGSATLHYLDGKGWYVTRSKVIDAHTGCSIYETHEMDQSDFTVLDIDTAKEWAIALCLVANANDRM